jgi:O-antigen/teichoic acid export membrane protein
MADRDEEPDHAPPAVAPGTGPSQHRGGVAAPSGRTLLRGTSLYLLQTVVASLVGLAALPVFTVFLTPDDFGIIAFATVAAAVVKIALTLGLDAAVARLYHDHRGDLEAQRVLLGTVALTLFVSVGGLGTLAALFGGPFYDLVLPDAQVSFDPYLELAILGIVAEQARVVPLTLLKTAERAGVFVALSAPADIGRVVARIVFVAALDLGAEGFLLASLLFDAALAVPFVYWLVRHTRLAFSFSVLRRALTFSVPLVPHMMAHWALHLADRIILERMVPMRALGLYGFGYQVARGWNDVNMAVADAWAPLYYRLAGEGAAGRAELARLQERVLAMLAVLSLAFALFSREIVELVSAPAYHEAAAIVPLVLGAYALHGLYVIFVSGIYHRKETRLLPVFTVLSALVNIGGNLLLIPEMGIAGAAWATLAGYGLLALAVVTHAQSVHPLPLRSRAGWWTTIGLFALAWAVSYVDGTLGVRLLAKLGVLAAFVGWLRLTGALPTRAQAKEIFARVRKSGP